MVTNSLNGVLQRCRREVFSRAGAGMTDGELLGRFVEGRDEDAFAALLHRHGPMVLGVCRRALRNEADAEDAFQATFLVLVSKAATVSPREMVGNWLYGVAHNTAVKAKAMNIRRRAREREAGTVTRRAARDEVWREVLAILDAELSGLPDRYRAPIVLCDLEGKTIAEAAAQLDCPQGTLATRLRRGRELLARRLSGRGLTLPTGVVAAAVSMSQTSASVPAALSASTMKAASLVAAGRAVTSGVVSTTVAALIQGVLKSMMLTKLKTVTAVALALILCGLGGTVALSGPAGGGAPVSGGALPTADPPEKPGGGKSQPTDTDRLQGIWTGSLTECRGGLPVTNNEDVKEFLKECFKFQALVKGDKLTLRGPSFLTGVVGPLGERKDTQFTFKLDEAKKPKWIDLSLPREEDDVYPVAVLGVYELDGDSLVLCLSCPNKKRPAEPKVQQRFAQVRIVLKRDPKAVWGELQQPKSNSAPNLPLPPADPFGKPAKTTGTLPDKPK